MRTLFAASFVVLLAAPALAGPGIAGKPKVVFHAEGSPGFLTFDGVTRELAVTESGGNLVFTVPMNTVETGISLRDQHMRETYVQTARFPDVVLTVPKGEVQWPEEGGRSEGTVQATFEAHGVSLSVPVTYDIKSAKGTFKIKATFPFDTSAHGIAIPEYLGVTIKPAMQAEVNLELTGA